MPMKVYRPTCLPPSTDSSRNASGSSAAMRRKADTGVSRSAVTVRYTGTRVCLRLSFRNSFAEGRELASTVGMAAFIITALLTYPAYSSLFRRKTGLDILCAQAYTPQVWPQTGLAEPVFCCKRGRSYGWRNADTTN